MTMSQIRPKTGTWTRCYRLIDGALTEVTGIRQGPTAYVWQTETRWAMRIIAHGYGTPRYFKTEKTALDYAHSALVRWL